jgi:hypothetical protein
MWHSEVVVLRISKIWERTRINIGLGKDAKDAERARKVLAGLARNILSHHSDWTHRLPVELRTLPDSSDSMRVRQEDRPGTQPRTRKLGPVIAALLLFASVMILFMPYNPVNPNHSALYEVITAFSCAISGATMCLNLYCPKQSGLVRWGWGFLVGVIWFSVVFYATALIMGRT